MPPLETNDYPTQVPVPQQLQQNPVLPQHPLGAYTDAQFEAAIAQLRADTMRRYNDVLKNLGYIDANTGLFAKGRLELEADKQRTEFGRGMRLAREDVTRQSQREGTLFSGYRGTQTARAEHPFVSALADLDVKVPQQLSDLYEQAGGIVDDFTRQQNFLLGEAAARRAAFFNNLPSSPGFGSPNYDPTQPHGPGNIPPQNPYGGLGGDIVDIPIFTPPKVRPGPGHAEV